MRIATISEAKNRLSALIDAVRAGEPVLIVDRGIPVAWLESAIAHPGDGSGRLSRLERAGVVKVAEQAVPLDLLLRPPPQPQSEASGLEALLEERRGGR